MYNLKKIFSFNSIFKITKTSSILKFPLNYYSKREYYYETDIKERLKEKHESKENKSKYVNPKYNTIQFDV
jgi:hypothetical protein